jgi:hypothetical protein
MTVQAFQQAFSDLIASPDLCLAVRRDPRQVLDRYDLSARERHRLVDVVWQRGMSTSCTLYRVNRITPIYTLLSHTCFVLGDEALIREAELFWEECKTDLQFQPEIDSFGVFLKRRIQAGAIDNPLIEEVLDLELSKNALRFLPRQRIARELNGMAPASDSAPLRLHPLVRVVRFRHDPGKLLQLLEERSASAYALPDGEFFLVLSAGTEELEIRRVDPGLGRLLLSIQAGTAPALGLEDAAILLQAGLVIRSDTLS